MLLLGLLWDTDRLIRQKRMFRGEWRESIWVDGSIYFYNTVTGENTKEIPEEGLYPKYVVFVDERFQHFSLKN